MKKTVAVMDWLLPKDPEKICKVSSHGDYIYIRKYSWGQPWALWLADVCWESPHRIIASKVGKDL